MPCSASGSASISADRHARIERRIRVLEDELRLAAIARAASGSPSANTSLPVEAHAPGGRLDQPQHQPADAWICREPDSPTSASVLPASTVKLTPSTACTMRERAAEAASGARRNASPGPSSLERSASHAPTSLLRAARASSATSARRRVERRAAARRGSRSSTNGQRSAKRQPTGGAVMSGTTPSIAASRSAR